MPKTALGSWIPPPVEVGRDCEPGSGARVADEVEDFGITVEGLGGPVFGDFGRQMVLDGIPFGGSYPKSVTALEVL